MESHPHRGNPAEAAAIESRAPELTLPDRAELPADPLDLVRDPARVAAVRASGLLDTPPDESFDRLTRLAVRLVGVPVAFVSLVDEFRDFYKSHCGFGEPLSLVREMEGTTFCHYAIASSEPLVIPDTRADPVYRHVPTVESLGIAAYAGFPIRTAEGVALGSFCAVDFEPREWSAADLEVLRELALSAEREIQLRTAVGISEAGIREARELNTQLQLQASALKSYLDERESLLLLAERAQREAENADRAKSQFLANMSHELRTPINAIVGYSELLELGLAGDLVAEQKAYVDRIKRSGTHLIGLVNEILDLAKIESGELEVSLTKLKLSSITEGALAMILPQANAKAQVVIEDVTCATDQLFLGDENRVRQIVVNLLSNAVKFTPSGGTITLACQPSCDGPSVTPRKEVARWFRFDVQDDGIGIAPENQEKVFEPFKQVDDQHTRTNTGTGLGLAISRKLARLMGGDLTLQSRAGKGSTFTLWLQSAEELPPG